MKGEKLKKIILIHLLLLLSACATNKTAPTYYESPVPDFDSKKAILYIYREYAEPIAFSSYLEIDGHKVASLKQEGFTWIYIDGLWYVKWGDQNQRTSM